MKKNPASLLSHFPQINYVFPNIFFQYKRIVFYCPTSILRNKRIVFVLSHFSFCKNKSNCILLFLFLNKMNGIKFIVPFVFLIDQNVLVFMVWVQPQFHHCFTYFFLRLRLPRFRSLELSRKIKKAY